MWVKWKWQIDHLKQIGFVGKADWLENPDKSIKALVTYRGIGKKVCLDSKDSSNQLADAHGA